MKTIKQILILTCMLMSCISFGYGDPLGVIYQDRLDREELTVRDIQVMAMDNWDKARGYINEEKLGFFHLNERERFIDYIYGAYDESPDWVRSQEAYDKTRFFMEYLSMGLMEGFRDYSKNEVKEILAEMSSWDITRYVNNDTKLSIYKMYRAVKNKI
jgi:hypothetical protein